MSSSDLSTQKISRFNLFFATIGERVLTLIEYVGGLFWLGMQTLKSFFTDRFNLKDTITQFEMVGIRSASLTNLIAVFTGMVFAIQFIEGLKRFGLQMYTGQVLGIAMVREMAPVLTAVMVAARVGSGITAEIGAMNVTEQVLAIEAMGASPIQKLVAPRVMATTLCTPILSLFAMLIGLIGGMFITVQEAGVTPWFYYDQVVKNLVLMDFWSGLLKPVFFGFTIGCIACFEGLKTSGGTEGVGRSTTFSVVYSCIAIFISDFFLTKIFFLIG